MCSENRTIIPWATARRVNLKRYYNGKRCKRGHIAERYVSGGECVVCGLERSRRLCALNPEKYREQAAAAMRRRRKANPEKYRAYQAAYRSTNKEKYRQYHRAWGQRHPDKVREISARKRAQKLCATPLWLTKMQRDEIKVFYSEAARLGLVVDHIVPLRGRNVCGLHIPWNLQLLTQRENSRKHNKVESTSDTRS